MFAGQGDRAETFVQQVRDGNVLTNEEIVLRRLKDIEVLINEENERVGTDGGQIMNQEPVAAYGPAPP